MLLYSREVLEEQSPSRKHGIDAQLEASYRWAYCEFLKDAGMELKNVRLGLKGQITTAQVTNIECPLAGPS